jgi:hypothetical protein
VVFLEEIRKKSGRNQKNQERIKKIRKKSGRKKSGQTELTLTKCVGMEGAFHRANPVCPAFPIVVFLER